MFAGITNVGQALVAAVGSGRGAGVIPGDHHTVALSAAELD